MSLEKCFCHLNGYAVKDAFARKKIEEIEKKIEDAPSGGSVTVTYDNSTENLTIK